jgi:starch synthase
LNTSTLIGVHNLPYHGPHIGTFLSDFDLPKATGSALPYWAQDIPLALGLLSADHIVTVSPSYAKEMQTLEFGAGLDHFLRSRSKDITGILNGIDLDIWDPSSDANLVKRFDSECLDDRMLNKIGLQREFGLDDSGHIPLIGMVTRLDQQKGVDLVPEALRQIAEMPEIKNRKWQFVLLGTGDPNIESQVRQFEIEFQNNVEVILQYDAELSHRIFSGADMLLIPSRYEPCGLTQMIAMRYGCIPIARATGGLNDTIQDYFETEESTGFLFSESKPEFLAKTIATALHVFQDRSSWHAMQNRAMNMDFSWAKSARLYMQLYLDLHCRRIVELKKIKNE